MSDTVIISLAPVAADCPSYTRRTGAGNTRQR